MIEQTFWQTCLQYSSEIDDKGYQKMKNISGQCMPSGHLFRLIVRKVFKEQDINKIQLQRVIPELLNSCLQKDSEEDMTTFEGINE